MVWQLVNALQDGMALADNNGMIALADTRLEQAFGYEHAELLGQPIEILLPVDLEAAPGSHRACRAPAPRTRPMGAGARLVGLRKDGTTFPAEISLSSVTTAAGHFALIVIRDITETRRAGLPAALSDPRRIAAVQATGLLDTEPEQPFDDLAGLAAGMTGCERAFITLVDEDRSFWKSCVGVDIQQTGRQNPARESFCYFLVGLGDRFVVDDAAEDPRTRDHPSVAPMKIGAWAGYPVLGPDGEVLGSMCVIDENPHPWQPAELAALGTLARAVSNEIDLRGSLAAVRESLLVSETLARSLQDSLLPPVLRPVPGLDVAAAYQPAAGGTTVVGTSTTCSMSGDRGGPPWSATRAARA